MPIFGKFEFLNGLTQDSFCLFSYFQQKFYRKIADLGVIRTQIVGVEASTLTTWPPPHPQIRTVNNKKALQYHNILQPKGATMRPLVKAPLFACLCMRLKLNWEKLYSTSNSLLLLKCISNLLLFQKKCQRIICPMNLKASKFETVLQFWQQLFFLPQLRW